MTEGKNQAYRSDDELPNHLPVQNSWAVTDFILIERLFGHTAGLEDVRLWHILSAGATPDSPLAEVFQRDPSVLRLRTRPGCTLIPTLASRGRAG